MRKDDGRQARPADDVGRPDGSAECIALDGGWEGSALVETLIDAAEALEAEYEGCDPYTSPLATASACREWAGQVDKGLGGREAPHGEAPPDET